MGFDEVSLAKIRKDVRFNPLYIGDFIQTYHLFIKQFTGSISSTLWRIQLFVADAPEVLKDFNEIIPLLYAWWF